MLATWLRLARRAAFTAGTRLAAGSRLAICCRLLRTLFFLGFAQETKADDAQELLHARRFLTACWTWDGFIGGALAAVIGARAAAAVVVIVTIGIVRHVVWV